MSQASSFSSAPVALSPSHRETPDILVYEGRSWRSIPYEPPRRRGIKMSQILTLGKKYEDAGGQSSRHLWRCDLCNHDTVMLLGKMMPGQVTVRDRLGFGRRALAFDCLAPVNPPRVRLSILLSPSVAFCCHVFTDFCCQHTTFRVSLSAAELCSILYHK